MWCVVLSWLHVLIALYSVSYSVHRDANRPCEPNICRSTASTAAGGGEKTIISRKHMSLSTIPHVANAEPSLATTISRTPSSQCRYPAAVQKARDKPFARYRQIGPWM
ncbi:hypothetical protein EDB81DRAFT_794700 [Dactylonectria macrodidyma]|uniref:Secreted protein n=1 Tax=Dactylonectria macrodidyma TaxID=307937 RepID=A0A9P9J3Z3_9HYPO|nr:hypothetical protein EDB81DRAFT_794700 [Dactylonectria macrodidyma]